MLEKNKGETLTIYDEFVGLADKFDFSDFVEVAIDTEQYHYVAIEIKGNLLFRSGEAELMEEAWPIISKVGDVLKQYSGYKVEVIGHTDNVPLSVPPYYNNDVLSFCRARTVAMYLAEEKNLGWENVEFTGRGEREPVASNETEDTRKENRRVEIRLYNKKNSGN